MSHSSIWLHMHGGRWDAALLELGRQLILIAATSHEEVLTQTDLGRVTGIGRRERVYRITQTLGITEEVKKALAKKRASRNNCIDKPRK